jgi:hypothetical protein
MLSTKAESMAFDFIQPGSPISQFPLGRDNTVMMCWLFDDGSPADDPVHTNLYGAIGTGNLVHIFFKAELLTRILARALFMQIMSLHTS